MALELARMRRVDLKSVIQQKDFIPWLLETGNIEVLQETIGFELSVQLLGTEKDHNLPDVMAKKLYAPDLGSWVLIESQYETTDNDFMARILGYIALVKPSNVIWIAERFSDKHKSILDWLNCMCSGQVQFYGLEIELWSVGKQIASKFNIVSRPQTWKKPDIKPLKSIKIKKKVGNNKVGRIPLERNASGLTKTKSIYLNFWTQFRAYLKKQDGIFQTNKPLPTYYTALSVGKKEIFLKSCISLQKQNISSELHFWGESSQPFFHILRLEKDQIHSELGYALIWDEMEDKTGSKILIKKGDVDLLNEDEWETYFAWMDKKVSDFIKVLQPRLRHINPDDWLNKIER